MPLTFVEAPASEGRAGTARLSVTVSVGDTNIATRLSMAAQDALHEMTDAQAIRLRVGKDGNRVALVIDPAGRTVSRSGSFAGAELFVALGKPKATVRHTLLPSDPKADGFSGFWVGPAVTKDAAPAAK